MQAVTCDTDSVNDGATVFAFSSLNSIVLNGQSGIKSSVVYYDSANVEMTDLSEVSNGETYTAVVTNTNTECQNSTDFMFTVNQLPEIQALNTVDFCDDDEVTSNTITIDLTEVITQFSYVTSAQAQAIDLSSTEMVPNFSTKNVGFRTWTRDLTVMLLQFETSKLLRKCCYAMGR